MSNFLFYSCLGHFTLLFVFMGNWSVIFFKKEVQIENAIRVDMLALPEIRTPLPRPIRRKKKELKILKKKKQVSLQQKKKLVKVPKPKPNLQNLESEQQKALDKLNTLSNIEKMQEDMEPIKYKGEKISKGQDMTGKILDNPVENQYFMNLKRHINLYWNLPKELAEANFKARIYVTIDTAGEVLNWRVVESSGSADFDARVLETIQRASPLPVPPTSQLKQKLAGGIVFNFPE